MRVLKSSNMGHLTYKTKSNTAAKNIKYKVPDTIHTNDFLVRSKKHCEDGSDIYKSSKEKLCIQ